MAKFFNGSLNDLLLKMQVDIQPLIKFFKKNNSVGGWRLHIEEKTPEISDRLTYPKFMVSKIISINVSKAFGCKKKSFFFINVFYDGEFLIESVPYRNLPIQNSFLVKKLEIHFCYQGDAYWFKIKPLKEFEHIILEIQPVIVDLVSEIQEKYEIKGKNIGLKVMFINKSYPEYQDKYVGDPVDYVKYISLISEKRRAKLLKGIE